MKLFTIIANGVTQVGVGLTEDTLLALADAHALQGGSGGPFGGMIDLIEAGQAGLDRARALASAPPQAAIHTFADVVLKAPLPVPARLRDSSMFTEHLEIIRKEMARLAVRDAADPEAELQKLLEGDFKLPDVLHRLCCYYNGNHHAVIGPDEPLRWPAMSEVLDYELEFAVVVGRGGRDLSPEQARDHVFGYTLMNDWSARDLQVDVSKSGAGPCMGKDFATSLGPCIVTADELSDPHDMALSAWVDGERWSEGSTRNMRHTVFEALSQFSRISPLVPGEVIGSGTCAYGSAAEQGRRLQPGQTVELRAEEIGSLTNQIQR
ncbi:fumarylacetoacetate hydrolase family protein [Caulobacter mirabilis]|uniref:Fumarylacetoacetate hydrolase n=1 Tax=Caulobacter mirabilis TaxID=69666 RepID=A0A2D2AY19_9CAUL|nr:fumarylacetoacetate hydrolase family protein [Caulobacter mirabilis]ATQ42919.1 fumarylacetoacetate hydrolase [Caulobacter mirabilis]